MKSNSRASGGAVRSAMSAMARACDALPCASRDCACLRKRRSADGACNSALLERVADGYPDGSRLRDDRLSAVAEEGRILVGADTEVVGEVAAEKRCHPVLPLEGHARVEHGVTPDIGDRRGERR